MKSGEGTLIAFATGPGQTALDGQEGSNSPFTRALLANLTQPGVEIQQAMTSVRAQVNEETHKGQLPWGHTNLIGAVYLNQAPTTQIANAAPTAAGSVPAAATAGSSEGVELEYWRSVKESNKPEELNAYLSAYPNGQFKALALARVPWLSVERLSHQAPAQGPALRDRGDHADGERRQREAGPACQRPLPERSGTASQRRRRSRRGLRGWRCRRHDGRHVPPLR